MVRPSLWAVVMWGRPGAEAVVPLVRSLRRELEPQIAPHRSVVDASRVEGVDAAAFEALMAYVGAESQALARQVERLALVRSSGLEGAAVAGFFVVQDKPYPVEVVSSLSEALRWLEVNDVDADAARLTRLYQASAEVAPVVSALRPHLTDRPSVAEAARRMYPRGPLRG